jgi:hypothetical protein
VCLCACHHGIAMAWGGEGTEPLLLGVCRSGTGLKPSKIDSASLERLSA